MRMHLKAYVGIFILFLTASITVHGQTYVSGGIFSNTTWTLANSPYIITDSVVVFPGLTLQINAGVVVKFNDNTNLEMRQATLIANGVIDGAGPVTFTSNSSAPHPGIWGCIFLNGAPATGASNFINCNFYYATTAVFDPDFFGPPLDHTVIRYCTFQNNITGTFIDCMGPVRFGSCLFDKNGTGAFFDQNEGINVELDSSTFTNNNIGIDGVGVNVKNCMIRSNAIGLNLSYFDTIRNNVVINNGIGYQNPGTPPGFYIGFNVLTNNLIANNNVGLLLDQAGDYFYCNSIFNDTTWDLQINSNSASNIANNYWGTNDSAVIQSHIYDGHNNVSYGLASFTPFETTQCTGVPSVSLSVPDQQHSAFDIYPNPGSATLNIILPENYLNSRFTIYNVLGGKETSGNITEPHTQVNISHLMPGNYIVEIICNSELKRRMFTKQQ